MARFLVVLGILLVLTGLLWPYLTRLGVGRLPGDILIEQGNLRLYLPIMTSLIVSIVLSVVLWFLGR